MADALVISPPCVDRIWVGSYFDEECKFDD